mgnify:CR=1 FL=1
MQNYYVNRHAQSNGDHEVHKEECEFCPTPLKREYLGSFANWSHAVKEARRRYGGAYGCFNCCVEVNTSLQKDAERMQLVDGQQEDGFFMPDQVRNHIAQTRREPAAEAPPQPCPSPRSTPHPGQAIWRARQQVK